MSETCNPTLPTAEQDPTPPDLFKAVAERVEVALVEHKSSARFEFILESETKEEKPVPVIKFCLADTYESFRTNKGEVLEVTVPLFVPDTDDPRIDWGSALPMLDELTPDRYFIVAHHNDRNTREFIVTDRGIEPSKEWSLFPRRLRRHKPSSQYIKHLRDKLVEFELVPLRRIDLPHFEIDGEDEGDAEADD